MSADLYKLSILTRVGIRNGGYGRGPHPATTHTAKRWPQAKLNQNERKTFLEMVYS
jgi:hypothetical protein